MLPSLHGTYVALQLNDHCQLSNLPLQFFFLSFFRHGCTTGMEPAARKDQESSVAAKTLKSSRLTCSAALPDTSKQDIDTDIVTADISRPCNGFAMLRHL